MEKLLGMLWSCLVFQYYVLREVDYVRLKIKVDLIGFWCQFDIWVGVVMDFLIGMFREELVLVNYGLVGVIFQIQDYRV